MSCMLQSVIKQQIRWFRSKQASFQCPPAATTQIRYCAPLQWAGGVSRKTLVITRTYRCCCSSHRYNCSAARGHKKCLSPRKIRKTINSLTKTKYELVPDESVTFHVRAIKPWIHWKPQHKAYPRDRINKGNTSLKLVFFDARRLDVITSTRGRRPYACIVLRALPGCFKQRLPKY